MNCQQMASVAFACVLVFGGPAPAPVWAQVAPAIERNPAAAGASAVAVLPFENISGQPQDDWLGAGIVESVLADLETRNVAVIGPAALRAEARREGTDLEVERNAIALSRRLGAAWLVTGGYQHFGDLLRITARVVDVRTGAVTNTVKVDGRWEDLFELQDRIVAELALHAPLVPSTGGVTGGQGAAAVADPTTGDSVSSALFAAPNRPFGLSPPTTAAPPTVAAFNLPAGYVGPPPPVAPATMSRDAQGRVTIRAVRLTSPLRIDGTLDEALYREVEPASDFVQIDPHDGQPAVDQTQVWLAFDEENVYFSVNALERDMDSLVANEMRRDIHTVFTANDVVAFLFDTFYDRRNALFLGFNPLGGINDGQVTNESNYSGDWNPVWSVRTRRNADGWSAEAAVPFKSIRYQPGREQVWGFQVERMKRSKNELSFLSRPPKARLMQAYQHVGAFATVVGIEAPVRSTSIDVKPFVTSNLVTDMSASPRIANDPSADFGVDAKVGVTQSLIADLTYNTDFAQVEADEQQVNLTRFGLFFPEKRDFFLENQGTFSFGGISSGGFGRRGDAPLLFYSRQIGVNKSRMVPIRGGGRLTGRVGKFTVGAIDMQSGDEEISGARSTNFSVLRVKRDLLRRSSVGAIFTGRSVSQDGLGSNQAYGVDGTFAFFQNLNINTYWARTDSAGRPGDNASYRGALDYNGDRFGVQMEHLDIGANFNPEIGFVRRVDLMKNRAFLRFSPRPRASPRIRKYIYQASFDLFRNHAGVTESREAQVDFHVDFQNASRIVLFYQNNYENLPVPFRIAPGVELPVGAYTYNNFHAGYMAPSQGRLAGGINTDIGTFYNGRKYTLRVLRGKVSLTPQLSIEPLYTLNVVRLVEGRFTAHLAGTRLTFTPTPLMFTSALVQYNSSTGSVSANVRLRWEYQPGSELFVVFNEERDARATRFPGLANRAIIVKVNRLFRF